MKTEIKRNKFLSASFETFRALRMRSQTHFDESIHSMIQLRGQSSFRIKNEAVSEDQHLQKELCFGLQYTFY